MAYTLSNDASIARFRAIAHKIEADPDLLAIPLRNIDRWPAADHSAPHRLEQWRTMVLRARETEQGLDALLRLLRDDGEESATSNLFPRFRES